MKSCVQRSIVEGYRPLLDSLGVTRAADLVPLPNRTEVVVAVVRVAAQTPPMRSGKRVVFISLDDGMSPVQYRTQALAA